MSEASAAGGRNPYILEMSQERNRGRESSPVTELMRAIILTTIRDLQGNGWRQREAVAYIQSREEDHIFSFIAICRYLGFDPGRARWKILGGAKIRTRRRNW